MRRALLALLVALLLAGCFTHRSAEASLVMGESREYPVEGQSWEVQAVRGALTVCFDAEEPLGRSPAEWPAKADRCAEGVSRAKAKWGERTGHVAVRCSDATGELPDGERHCHYRFEARRLGI